MMIGDTIQKLRKQAHMSQAEMAEQLSVVRQTISKWETGKGGWYSLACLDPTGREFVL